jgi:histidine triad (HIT) family protein
MEFNYDPENIFAKILRGEIPNKTVFENDHALAFHDIMPQAEVHVLVIPKGPYMSLDHFARDASAEEQVGFMAAVAEVCKITGVKDGFRAIANSREHGVQEVPHFHLHIIGGQQLGRMLPKA